MMWSRLLGAPVFEWNVLTLTVNALRCVSSAARQSASSALPQKISVYDSMKVGRGWAGLLLLLSP